MSLYKFTYTPLVMFGRLVSLNLEWINLSLCFCVRFVISDVCSLAILATRMPFHCCMVNPAFFVNSWNGIKKKITVVVTVFN